MVKGITENVDRVRSLIREACQAAGRSPDEVTLMAVTKTQPVAVLRAAQEAGLGLFGENRVQEAVEKIAACGGSPAQWELIGHLQSNKVRPAVEHFDRIQSVDRAKLAIALDRQAALQGRDVLPILLQVNAGEDPAKFGCRVEEAPALVETIFGLERLRLDGFMTIAPLDENPAVARRAFARLRRLRDQLAESWGQPFGVLSMGMSGDLAEAIAEGSTLVRVGSALFGARDR